MIAFGAVLVESPDDCNSPGLVCLGCPHYAECDHHYDPDLEEDEQ